MSTLIAKDPVCGMDVDRETSLLSAKHGEKLYYFCSAGCKDAFQREPERYLGADYKPSMMGAMLGRVRGLFGGKHA